MSEQQQQPDQGRSLATQPRIDHIRSIFLSAIEPLVEDLNSEEVLFFVKKSFELGFEALALKSEGVHEGMTMAHQQMQQRQAQQQLQQQIQGAVSERVQQEQQTDLSVGHYL